MAKKRSWFNLLKRFFLVADANTRSEKKDQRRRSWIFGRFKNKRLASLSAAPSSPPKKTQNDVEEKQKSAIEVAATAAFGTAQKSTTQVAECISGCSPQSSTDKCKNEFQELSAIKLYGPAPQSYQHELEIQHLAATKIQSAFRGYLARKALRALKGLVRLQALIRGWAVRRHAMNTLKCLQTIVNIQSEVCAKRCDMVKGTHNNQENRLQDYIEKDIKVDSNSQKRWDDSLLSKEETNALSTSKRVAAINRERIKEYRLNHRRSTESEQNRLSGKQRHWLEKWVDAQLAKREDLQNSDEVFSSTAKNRDEFNSRQIKLRNLQKHCQIEAFDSPIHVPRRSFHQRKRSIGEEGCLGSPAVPTYMAATESAKAKARSLSTPRLRPIPMDAYSQINSPYKHKLLSPISSINSEMTCNTQISRNINFSQRSPCLKGIPGPVKSNNRTIRDLRFISEYSLPN